MLTQRLLSPSPYGQSLKAAAETENLLLLPEYPKSSSYARTPAIHCVKKCKRNNVLSALKQERIKDLQENDDDE